MHSVRLRRSFVARSALCVVAVVGVVAAVAVAAATLALPAGAAVRPGTSVALTTPALAPYTDRVDLPPAGPSVGDIVTFHAPVSRNGSSTVIGYMTGSLRNASIDFPRPGTAVREVNLVFVLRDGKDQLVIGGVAEYPLDASTLPLPSTTVRPLVGGMGRYAGARGWVETVHAADDTWTHTFHFTN